jgi:hypothetical protein
MATRISTALYRPSLDPRSGDKSSICDHEWTRLPARQRHAMTRQPPPSFRSDSVSERALRAFRCGTLEYVRWCGADQVAGRMESNPPRHYHTQRHPRTAQLKVSNAGRRVVERLLPHPPASGARRKPEERWARATGFAVLRACPCPCRLLFDRPGVTALTVPCGCRCGPARAATGHARRGELELGRRIWRRA